MENNVRKILSQSLQELMKENNVDQKELAEALGVTQPTVSNWINQSKYPRIKRIQQIADYFNVPKSRVTEGKKKLKEPETVAAHFNKDDLTEEEMKEVQEFIEFVKSKRK